MAVVDHVSAAADGGTHLDRELSWLDFDRRVLELASDAAVPLLERVRLAAIAAGNLDEFYAVRVGRLRRQAAPVARRRTRDAHEAAARLRAVHASAVGLLQLEAALWHDDLKPALTAAGVRVVGVAEMAPRDRRTLDKRYAREIEPLLTPIALDTGTSFPYLQSGALNLAVAIRRPSTGAQSFVRVNVPAGLPRLLPVSNGGFVPVEELIVHHLGALLGGPVVQSVAVFRVLRDAHLVFDDGSDGPLEEIEEQLAQRRRGPIVRLDVDGAAPPVLTRLLRSALGLERDQVLRPAAPLALRDLHELASIDRPDLTYPSWEPVTPRAFADRSPADLLARTRRRDVLVHHPYESFEKSVQAFVDAARDPKVAALKTTVYRTGHPAPTVEALVGTAEEGKQSLCLIELRARFDERRNIEWARALERSGVDVVHGLPATKVHAKITLLVRDERNGPRRYVHLGTGNYHAVNAFAYEDVSLFTADDDIAADVAQLFNALTARTRPPAFRRLLVGPWFLREGILREIDEVVAAVARGERGRIRIKVNALSDPGIVQALYDASQAGVEVELIVRGICTLRPGVPGLSDGIVVRSVLGRFLEHSRILSFQAGDRVNVWLGSADLMPRNLDRRVETLVPVDDSRLRAQLSTIFDTLLADRRSSWELGPDGGWRRLEPGGRAPSFSAQDAFARRAYRRARKRR